MTFLQKFSLPFISNFRSTTLTKAFILNAFVTALITIFAIELRRLFDNEKSVIYGYVNNWYGSKSLSNIQIVNVVFVATFFAAVLVYIMMYVIFHYGGGLLTQDGTMTF